jgi:hypothetical protein
MWFDALANDEIMSEEENIRINRSSLFTKIYRSVMEGVEDEANKCSASQKCEL